MSKLIQSIREAIEKAGLKDGMTISFHHHMRNGDYVLNMVLEEAAAMGIRDLTVNASSIFDIHEPLIEHIKNGVVTQIECNYMGGKVGKAISQGIMELEPDDREILILFYYQELKLKEIASVIGRSENASMQRLNRARKRLKKILEGLL